MVHNGCWKTSCATRTRLLTSKSESDIAQSATLASIDRIHSTMDSLNILQESRDVEVDSAVDTPANEKEDSQVPSYQPINRGLQVRLGEIRRVVDKAKALIPHPIRSRAINGISSSWWKK